MRLEPGRNNPGSFIFCFEILGLKKGDYGTSPRSGWINNKDDFYKFIDDITETYKERIN